MIEQIIIALIVIAAAAYLIGRMRKSVTGSGCACESEGDCPAAKRNGRTDCASRIGQSDC